VKASSNLFWFDYQNKAIKREKDQILRKNYGQNQSKIPMLSKKIALQYNPL